MTRLPRFFILDVPQHIIQHSNNREKNKSVFFLLTSAKYRQHTCVSVKPVMEYFPVGKKAHQREVT